MRTCTKCSTPKPLEDFYKDKRAPDGCVSKCKKCCTIVGREQYRKNPAKAMARSKNWQSKNKPKINESRKKQYYKKKEKNPDLNKEFYAKYKERIKAARKLNPKIYTEEERLKQKAYREANKERIKAVRQEHQKKNSKRLSAISRKYHLDNLEKRKQYLKDYLPIRRELRRQRHDSDSLYRVKVNLRNCITRAFKLRQGWGKTGKSEEILGCSFETAIKHIERQLKEGMTWENHGASHGHWNIDHIVPLASAKTVEEVKILCHYSNLQPLWFIDNVRKQDKILPVQLKIAI